MRSLILIALASSTLLAYCPKIDCSDTVVMEKEKSIQILQVEYDRLNEKLDEMLSLENKYNNALKRQNELLEQLERLEKASLEFENELLFLAKQNNKILDKVIDLDLTEKIQEQEEE